MTTDKPSTAGVQPSDAEATLGCPTGTGAIPQEAVDFEGEAGRACGEHRTVGPHRVWCDECGEWCYPDECKGCEVFRLTDNLAAARQQLDAVRALAENAEPGLSLDPADCTYACDDGPCNCSGVLRTRAWSLDPAAVLAALAVAPTDAPATKDGQ